MIVSDSFLLLRIGSQISNPLKKYYKLMKKYGNNGRKGSKIIDRAKNILNLLLLKYYSKQFSKIITISS